jgi:hypothetical protein
MFERFCPPPASNNRRGARGKGLGKGPVHDFRIKAFEVAEREDAQHAAALRSIVADMEAEVQAYTALESARPLDALYVLLPAWCLQERIDLVCGSWWEEADIMLLVARKLRETFRSEASGDPARGFIACARDVPAEALPEDLADTELLDMSDLSFLVTLREQLAAWLTPTPEEEPVEEAPEPEPASVEISSSDIAVVKEFYRQYTGHYLLVQNNASVNARIVSNTMMYDAENNVIGVTGGMADAVAPGATVLIYEPIIDAENRIDHLETTFDAAEAREVQSALQDLKAVRS